MNLTDRIFIAGHNGMVGSAIVRELKRLGYKNIFAVGKYSVDLRKQQQVEVYFRAIKPDYVFLAAAKVGGIMANSTKRADFIYDNLMIEANIINAAHMVGVKKLLFLGSSCIYPKNAPQPLKEEYLLTSELEPTNEPYAIAKIAGIKMCEAYRHQHGCNFISAMPCNLYGRGDNYDLNTSHVIPALIRKIATVHALQQPCVEVWGDGTPLREFMYVDDLAEILVALMDKYDGKEPINVGTGEEISIGGLTALIAEVIGYKGQILYDTSKPNGTMRKVMDTSKMESLGLKFKTGLQDGLKKTYQYYLQDI